MTSKWVILLAAFIHITWGIGIFVDHGTIKVTAANALADLDYISASIIFFFAGVLALIPVIYQKTTWSILLLVPQQILLILSGVEVLQFSFAGQFPDGYIPTNEHPGLFIFVDQGFMFWLALLHFCEGIGEILNVRRQKRIRDEAVSQTSS